MGFVLALISSAAFGLIPLFSLPLLHSGLSADCVLFYRFLFASISLGLILVLRQERLAAPARDLGLLALFSVLYALAALLMIWGLLYLSGGVTATLQFLYPLMVMLIMTIFFHEKFSIITASSVLLAILGVALLGSGGGDDGGSLDPLGVGLLLASALCNALYISGLHVARIHSISGLSITFWVLFFGTGVSLVNALISGTFEIIGTWEQLALSLLLAIITAVISNLTLILAIQRIGSTLASILGVGEPLTAVTVGILVFDEPATFAGRHLRRRGPGHDRAADPGLAAEKKAWGVDTRGRRPSLWTPLPLKLPFSLPKHFFRVSGGPHGTQARLLLTVSDGSSRRPAHPRSFPAIPIPGHGVPYAPGSRTHDAYGCSWAPSRAAFLPAVARGLFPAIVPLPSPPSRHRSLP